MFIPTSDLINVWHPVVTRTNITKRKNNPEYFFIFFIFFKPNISLYK